MSNESRLWKNLFFFTGLEEPTLIPLREQTISRVRTKQQNFQRQENNNSEQQNKDDSSNQMKCPSLNLSFHTHSPNKDKKVLMWQKKKIHFNMEQI